MPETFPLRGKGSIEDGKKRQLMKINNSLIRLFVIFSVVNSARAEGLSFLKKFSGGITTSGKQIEKDKFGNETSLELRWSTEEISFDTRFSGNYEPSVTDPQKMIFTPTEKLFNFYTKNLKVFAGDITPEFSEYTLYSPANKGGIELELNYWETYFQPVYLILQEANEEKTEFAKTLVGAALTKKGLPFGSSISISGYRSADDKFSIKEWKEKKPAETFTYSSKIEISPSAPFEFIQLTGEFANSEHDFDVTDSTPAIKDYAFKFGLNFNWDRWNISSNFSVCNKNFVAAGADTVDSDKSQLSATIGYNFSDYINATWTENTVTDGISEKTEQQVKSQNSGIAISVSFPKLPSLNVNYCMNKNTNFWRTVNDENTEFGIGLSYTLTKYLTGITINGNMNINSFTDYTKRTNDSTTNSYTAGINIPLKFLNVGMVLTPNFALTEDINKVTKNITKYENYAAGLTFSLWMNKIITTFTVGQNISYDTQRSIDAKTNSLNAQLVVNIINNLKLTSTYSKSQSEDRITPANNKSADTFSFSTTFLF